jgi:hypothetical protein
MKGCPQTLKIVRLFIKYLVKSCRLLSRRTRTRKYRAAYKSRWLADSHALSGMKSRGQRFLRSLFVLFFGDIECFPILSIDFCFLNELIIEWKREVNK